MDTYCFKGSPTPPIESLDLTTKGVMGHFARETRSAQLQTLLLSMNTLDHWAIDQDHADGSPQFDIQLLLQEVQDLMDGCASSLHQVSRPLAEMLAHLTTPRCTYLLQYVIQQNAAFKPALAPLLADDGSESLELSVFRQRLEVFTKARLLSEIFSNERLCEISQIMENYADV